MYKSAFAGVFLMFAILASQNVTASALTENGSNQIKLESSVIANLQGMPFQGTTPLAPIDKEELGDASAPPEKPAEPPAPKQHTVMDGESLAKIAEANQTTWVRIFNKNTAVTDPNTITPGLTVIIPLPDEQLAERPLPELVIAAIPKPVAPTTRATRAPRAQSAAPVGSSAGNSYSPGYCTWYAKNRRPDLPNNLGNADTWVARAAAQGLATGSAPRAGAIGQQGMHVVYIESVNGDGTVTVSEMNYQGRGVISSRTVPASSFRYIY